MEAIRRIVTVKNNTLNVTLPDAFNDMRVELIILPADEKTVSTVEEPGPDYKSLYGSFQSGLSIEEIDAQLKLLRSEWDKDIS